MACKTAFSVIRAPRSLLESEGTDACGSCVPRCRRPSGVVDGEGARCDGGQAWLLHWQPCARLASTETQVLQTLGFCLSALVSTSDGYSNMLLFLNKKNGLELRTEGLWCVSLCRG